MPAIFDMVSLGAVAVAPDADGVLALGADFYVEIKPCCPRIDAVAAKIHGLDQARLAAEGKPRREALAALTAWVEQTTVKGTKPVFVGHNAPFDWSFVAYSYAAEDLANPFGWKALDTKALAQGVLGLHWFDTHKEKLSELLALPAEDKKQKHRADYDARYQAGILLALLARMGHGTG